MAVTLGRRDFSQSTDAYQQQLGRRVLKVGVKGHLPSKAGADSVPGFHPSDASTTTVGSASHTSRCSSLDKDRYILRQRVAEAAQLPVRFPHEENAATYLTMAARLFSMRAKATESSSRCSTSSGDSAEEISSKFSCFRAESTSERSRALNLAQELGNHFKAQKPAYIFAISYLERISARAGRPNFKHSLNSETFARMVTALLMVAIKFSDDIYNTNSYYSQVLGLDVLIFNQMEREILRLLEFDASVKADTYRRIDEEFETSRYRVCAQAGRPVLCGDYTLPISPEILLYANTYGFEKTLQDCGDFLTLELQDSLIARRAGNCKFQTEAERILAASLQQKTDHMARLIETAHNEFLKLMRAQSSRTR